MPILSRKMALTAKIETTYNTDSAPTGLANAMMVEEASIDPMVMDTEGRIIVKPTLGQDELFVNGTCTTLTLKVRLSGSGAAGTVPGWGVLERITGHSEVITAGTSVVYAPVNTGFESGTVYFYKDGQLCKMTGCRGNRSIDATSKKGLMAVYTIWGMFNAVTDTALPTPTYTGFATPLNVSKANTPTFTVLGATPILQSLKLDDKTSLMYRNLVNHESIQIVDRLPEGSMTIEAPTIATKDWFTAIKTATKGALQLVHGSTAGNIVQIDVAGGLQPVDIKYSSADNIEHLDMNLRLIQDFTLTVK